MKLYRIASYTGPKGLESCVEPDPAPPTGRQVLVRVRASSLNYRELLDVQGALAKWVHLPERRIPGSDAAGEVAAVGSDVRLFAPGDRVATIFYPEWLRGPLPADLQVIGRSARENDGTLTQFTAVDEDELVRIPAHLSFEEAATLPCAAVTAWTSLFVHASVRPGDAVLIEGTGGVAVFALQFARMAGARAIVTTRSPSKAARLRELGAHEVVVTDGNADWPTVVRAAAGGGGVDWALSTAGGAYLQGCVAATRPGGAVVIIGVRDTNTQPTSTAVFTMRGVSLHSTRVGSREHFEQMNRAIAANRVRPVVDRVFEFNEAVAAFEYFSSGSHVGKVVIRH